MKIKMFSALVDDLYQSSLQGQLSSFLEVVATQTRSNKCFMSVDGNVIVNDQSKEIKDDIDRYMTEIQDDPFFLSSLDTPLGKPVLITEHIRNQIKDSSVEWAYEKTDVTYGVGISHTLDGQFIGLGINREAQAGDYSDVDVEFLTLLAPHIKRAVAIQNALDGVYLREQAIKAAVEMCEQRVCVVTGQGQLIAANLEFENWLAGQRSVKRDTFGIKFNQTPLYERYLALCYHASSGNAGELVLNNEQCVIRCLPLPKSLGDKLVMNVILTPEFYNYTWTKELYQLTNKEYETLNFLVKGLTTREISEQMSISYEAVRKHIKEILAKSSTHSQQELLSLLSSYR